MVIRHFLTVIEGKGVAFIVPTAALVKQQSNFIRKVLTNSGISSFPTRSTLSFQPSVVELSGDATEGWQRVHWDDTRSRHHVLVGEFRITGCDLIV